MIDAFGQSEPTKLEEHSKSLKHLSDLLSGSEQRLLIIGGAGSLFVDSSHTMRLVDSPDFPEQFKATALAQTKTLEEIKQRDNVQWTFMSPAPDFQFDGDRTGTYKISKDEVIGTNVSYADFAIAMVDEVINPKYIQQRFAVFA
ncbi:NAD(P)-dependent oxidoreductase [Staphylococcus caeli]|uniref:NADH-flavin reductase n=1 Tax=Staphylococcus caeli TaxID=2201815 RepID=A0A1D4LUS6_9STAP|nr:NAD(P)-dependent oxidoreductase [Staphylococcus caeli]SCS53243.1 putative NADH-flavin reductase [Staphylococcus caeli]SCS89981.1 putative NADH-flavin reductase [Staphylococcus caeli]